MDAKEKAAIEINDQKEELRSIASESPLYLDMTFFEKENFVRYFVSFVLQ
jgi:hypothetical protein